MENIKEVSKNDEDNYDNMYSNPSKTIDQTSQINALLPEEKF